MFELQDFIIDLIEDLDEDEDAKTIEALESILEYIHVHRL